MAPGIIYLITSDVYIYSVVYVKWINNIYQECMGKNKYTSMFS